MDFFLIKFSEPFMVTGLVTYQDGKIIDTVSQIYMSKKLLCKGSHRIMVLRDITGENANLDQFDNLYLTYKCQSQSKNQISSFSTQCLLTGTFLFILAFSGCRQLLQATSNKKRNNEGAETSRSLIPHDVITGFKKGWSQKRCGECHLQHKTQIERFNSLY